MKDILDNKELEEIMNILENLEDEELAVRLLRDFNNATKELGLLVVNKDPKISHQEWKELCDEAKMKVENVVSQILSANKS